jgi:hypothetical protein
MNEIRFPSMNLGGRIAIVTGAGQGLGLWMAQGLGPSIPHFPFRPALHGVQGSPEPYLVQGALGI